MRVVAIFKNPLFLSIIGLIALSLAIWFGGAYIAVGNPPKPLSEMTRLIIIMVILVLWGLNNLRIQLKGRAENDKFIEDIGNSSKSAAGDDQTTEEVAALQSRFKDALATIKSLRFGEKGKSKTVYELPWYLVIGPPGAGKTTILANSGLNFPLKEKFGLKGIGGVGGTRNCDWWFTDQAVLIDTAGRYTTQDSQKEVDQSAWQNFLSLLKKHRPRRAINGVVVALSVSELLTLSRSERAAHAETIRERIHELRTRLEINFPIYFVLTKCDLVAGFNEFFEDLGQVEREQVWGISFPYDKENHQVQLDFFAGEFDALVKRINERLIWRMQNERDLTRLGKIQNFPTQFESLKEILDQFIKDVFSDNRYQKQPLLRGVYFTSGTQEGTPIDRILSSLSAGYGISVNSLSAPPGQGKAYFIKRLLNDVIFRESGIVGLNRGFERKMKMARRVSLAAMLVLTLGVIGVWAASLIKNKQMMAQVEEKIEQHHQAVMNAQATPNDPAAIAALLQPLDEAREIYTEISAPWLSSLGMYDSSVPEAARKAYLAALQSYYLPVLAHELESILNDPPSDDALYNALRVYLMLGDEKRMEPEAVKRWFGRHWADQLSSRATLQASLMHYLDDALGLNERLNHRFQATALNSTVVEKARIKAREVPVEYRIYNQIRNQPEYAKIIHLGTETGREINDVFDLEKAGNKLQIPVLFTKSAYNQLDFSKDSPLIRRYASEQWILGTEQAEDFSDEDIEKIGNKVKNLYLAEYAETWKQALASLQVRSFRHLDDARDALKAATSVAASPITRIIELANAETTLTPRVKLLARKEGEEGLLSDAKDALASKALPPTLVDNEFSALHQFHDNQEMSSIQKRLSDLNELLEGFALAPNQSAEAFKFASGRFTGSGKDPVRSLLVTARQTIKPLDKWLSEIADQSWKVTLNAGKAHLNQLWNTEVYSFYQASLKGRYPFQRNATSDASLVDFTEFFKPGGIEEKFFRKYLTPFLTKKGNQLVQRSVGGRSIGISSDAREQIKRADIIRRVFFRKSASQPGVDFTLKTRRMDQSVRRFEMDAGNVRIRYSHGPKLPKSLSWPFGGDNAIHLLFEDINETQRIRDFTGEWAFFRLLDASAIETTNQPNLFYVTFNVEGRKIQYELKANSFLNPFRSGWVSQYVCPAQL